MEKNELYKYIIESLPLLDDDRKALKKKRGFTDDVINQLQFRSCGKDLVSQLDLPEKVRLAMSTPNILIPYFSVENEIVHLRPHKFGIAGEGVQVYIPYPLIPDVNKTIVIAESEFKAVASCMMGIPAVGVPGIASFSRDRFDELAAKVKNLGAEQAVICFDNEIKDSPEYPNFKPDYTKRYDTQLYAFLIAMQMKKVLPCTIATLDSQFMEQGKIDIDGWLAQGGPVTKYQNCIEEALEPRAYKNTWKTMPKAHLSYLERRIDRFFYAGPIKEENNCYYIKEGAKDIKISNFVLRVMHTEAGDEGAERYCYFKSNYGDSARFVLKPEHMASRSAFLKLCYERGDYEYSGKEPDIQKIWSYIFMHQSGRMIQKIDYYGYHTDKKTWFFANGAYRDDQFYPLDEEGVAWIDDIGYRIVTQENDTLPPPILNMEQPPFSLDDVFEKFSTKMGKHYASLILAWTLGNFFMPEILEKYHTYPFLFLYGKMSAGKSTISNWISSFFGFEQKGFPFSTSTAVGIQRASSLMSMIPIWLEEYRNRDGDIAKKNSYLRSIYDKSTVVKGTKREKVVKAYTARSTLILSGEEHPRDAALNSRCIMYGVNSAEGEDNKKAYEWLQIHKSLFSYFGHWILTHKKELWPKVDYQIQEYLKGFSAADRQLRHRNINHHSIIAGICSALIQDSDDFSTFIGEITASADKRRDEEMALNVFWEDIADLHGTGQIQFSFYGISANVEGKMFGQVSEIGIWFSGLYQTWETKFKMLRQDIPASKQALIDHMKHEPYFRSYKSFRLKDGGGKSCLVFDWNSPYLPEPLRNMIQNAELKDRNSVLKDHHNQFTFIGGNTNG